MRNLLRRWLRGDAAPAPALTPATFESARLPEIDEVEPCEAPSDLSPDVDLNGRALIISYTDSRGEPSERRIIAKLCYVAGALTYLQAICLERRASRTFRVDRISAVYCGVTGEDLGAPAVFFIPSEAREKPQGPRGRARRPAAQYPEMRAVLGLLITVARSDGEVHASEREVLERFVQKTMPEETDQAVLDDLVAWAWERAPSYDLFMSGCDFAFEQQPEWGLTLISAVTDMIRADGKVTPEELGLRDDMLWIAKACGIS